LLDQRVAGLGRLRQREEALGHREGAVRLGPADAVALELEEPDVGGGGPELLGDLLAAVVEVAEVDDPDLPGERLGADSAHLAFAVELGEVVGGHGGLLRQWWMVAVCSAGG